jgi:hypothetical protein
MSGFTPHPDAIELPLQQIRGGSVFVAEIADSVLGFAAILPRENGDFDVYRQDARDLTPGESGGRLNSQRLEPLSRRYLRHGNSTGYARGRD